MLFLRQSFLEVDCDQPKNITSAVMISNNGTGWRDRVFYTCMSESGEVTDQVLEGVCMEDGSWSYPACSKQGQGKTVFYIFGVVTCILEWHDSIKI